MAVTILTHDGRRLDDLPAAERQRIVNWVAEALYASCIVPAVQERLATDIAAGHWRDAQREEHT